MRICPRNAAVYGHQLTEQQAEEWCQRVKGQQCNGIKCRWNSKEVAIVKVKRDAAAFKKMVQESTGIPVSVEG